jgi:hypothetical protein
MDEQRTAAPPIGWIRDAADGFANERDARDATSLAGVALDASRLAYFRAYRETWYRDRLVPGQGTEEILDTLARHGRGERWLDLGAGTTTLLWSLALDGVTSIACADLVAEALATLEAFAQSQEVPPCYADALARMGRTAAHLAAMRDRIDRYLVFDALAPWPSWLAEERFDLITAFGLLGIAPSPDGYARCLREIARHAANGARVLGAEWLRSPALIARDGHDNSYLSPAQVARAASQAGLTTLACREVPVAGDPCYRGVVCWAFALASASAGSRGADTRRKPRRRRGFRSSSGAS